jgi:hypothetical protein
MIKGFGTSRSSRAVWTTVAAKWLSHGILDQHALSRLAGAGPVQEPTMTGALAKARETTLDPCIPPKRS